MNILLGRKNPYPSPHLLACEISDTEQFWRQAIKLTKHREDSVIPHTGICPEVGEESPSICHKIFSCVRGRRATLVLELCSANANLCEQIPVTQNEDSTGQLSHTAKGKTTQKEAGTARDFFLVLHYAFKFQVRLLVSEKGAFGAFHENRPRTSWQMTTQRRRR